MLTNGISPRVAIGIAVWYDTCTTTSAAGAWGLAGPRRAACMYAVPVRQRKNRRWLLSAGNLSPSHADVVVRRNLDSFNFMVNPTRFACVTSFQYLKCGVSYLKPTNVVRERCGSNPMVYPHTPSMLVPGTLRTTAISFVLSKSSIPAAVYLT